MSSKKEPMVLNGHNYGMKVQDMETLLTLNLFSSSQILWFWTLKMNTRN